MKWMYEITQKLKNLEAIEWVIVATLTLVIFGLFFPVVIAARRSMLGEEPKVIQKTDWRYTRFEFNGHQYIDFSDNILHDPDCPCGGR